MMLSNRPRYLPRHLRGKGGASRWLPWLVAFVLLAVLLILLIYFYPHVLFQK